MASTPSSACGHADPARDNAIARVMLAEPLGLLDYRIPEALQPHVHVGTPVRVPLGRRRSWGYVSSLQTVSQAPQANLKPLDAIEDTLPPLSQSVIELLLFAAGYYLALPGDILATALPPSSRSASRRYALTELGRWRLQTGQPGSRDVALLGLAAQFPSGFTAAAVERELGWSRRAANNALRKQTAAGHLQAARAHKGPRRVHAYRRRETPAPADLSTGLAQLWQQLPSDTPVLASTLAADDPGAYRKLKTLLSKGLVEQLSVEKRRAPDYATAPSAFPESPPSPNAAQENALRDLFAAVDAQCFQPFLLQGVTGSGKTEVYLRLIERCLQHGRTALVLVPEIALTPQLGARFQHRFGEEVATFHSGLTAAERRDEWERVARGRARVGLGARSALFLPLQNVGVIVVDEEHETSFKQEDAPRHNARDLAVVRAQKEGAVVVLGSATPALETRANAEHGRYRRLVLPERVADRPMPDVAVVNMTSTPKVGEGIFSEELARAMDATLSSGEQVILFLNRRGFAPYVFCADCGHAYRCPECDVSLTLHRRRDVLLCHYCGFQQQAPEICSQCESHRLRASGIGTEKLQEEIRSLFGDVNVIRLDRDTVRRRTELTQQLQRFRAGDAQILLGTQMVAKGHDFPGVTLVGVISADATLNFPDFRAAERTFQLLTQVAGRAGRGTRAGRVLVQSYDPEHYAIATAARHDYEAFAAAELPNRRELDYPPFAHLAMLRFEAEQENVAWSEAERACATLRHASEQRDHAVSILGPAPAPIARLKGVWRVQILLKCRERQVLRSLLQQLGPAPKHGRRILDVDPMNML